MWNPLENKTVLVAAAVMAVGAFAYAQKDDGPNFTKPLIVDTTEGFQIKRTISVSTTSDPIMAARESLFAQQNLCNRAFDIDQFDVVSVRYQVTYEAKIRCK